MPENSITEINAHEVTVEVRDELTGEVCRRTLPIDFHENANGLRLTAENADGKPVTMVFYSDAGLRHLRDLTGGGPDADPCGGHSGKST